MHYRIPQILMALLFSVISLAAQDIDANQKKRRSKLILAIGHANIPTAVQIGSDQGMTLVPSWGVAYSFKVNEKWSIGFKSDFEYASYVIFDRDKREIERENPISLALATEYLIYKGLGAILAVGYEFEPKENLPIGILGLFYEIEFRDRWNLTPEVLYELKGGHTGAITYAIGVGYQF